jgi:HSP20 family molecular chaperone IbpA
VTAVGAEDACKAITRLEEATMADTAIEKQEAQELEGAERTRTRRVFIPKVDIFETGDTIVLVADMPGVSEDGVDITLEKNVLTIRGYTDDRMHENFILAYSEYREGDYERTFALSDEVDRSKIEASIKDGVLQLTMPKAEEMRTRKIEVKTS